MNSICAILLVLVQLCRAASAIEPFNLIFLSPSKQVYHTIAAGILALEVDILKYSRPELEQQFGPPIIEVRNVHPALRIGFLFDDPTVEPVRILVERIADSSSASSFVGVVAGGESSDMAQMASVADAFHRPQVLWGGVGHGHSDKSYFPYQSRIASSELAEGRASWAWLEWFALPSASCIHGDGSDDSSGRDRCEAMLDMAEASGDVLRVNIVTAALADFNISSAQMSLAELQQNGDRFLILAMDAASTAFLTYVMELEGMLYSGLYQLLCFTGTEVLHQTLRPSRGLPVGTHQYAVTTTAAKVARLAEMWSDLSSADISEASLNGTLLQQRGLVNINVSAVDLTDPTVSFLFDAGYAFVHALSSLLEQGIPAANASGPRLLAEIRATSFEGMSGRVAFDPQGERVGSAIALQNFRARSNTSLDAHEVYQIGQFDLGSRELSMWQHPVWANGEESEFPPEALLACPFGFETDTVSQRCTPCKPGKGCGYRAEDGFPVGIFGPFTSVSGSQGDMAAAILFDLDFRKNTEPLLVERFGPPIINMSNLHPDLKIKVQLGTSDSVVNTAVETVLNWFLGIGGAHQVVGVCGGWHSAIAAPVASNAAVFQVPQVAWGATSARLSDKTLYPWLSRVIAPDSLQGSAIWAWLNHFSIPSAAWMYNREPYGEGLFQESAQLANAAGQGGRLTGIAMPVMTEADFNVEVAVAALDSVRSAGTRFIVVGASDPGTATSLLAVMEEQGMLYSASYQVLGIDSFAIDASRSLQPSRGLPVGTQKMSQVSRGSLYPRFLEMWHRMTPEDVYGEAAQKRYLIDKFLVHPSEAAQQMLTEDDFAVEPWIYSPFIFDSAYAFVFALNNLLNAGVAPHEIYGPVLLDEVRKTNFEGITGLVTLDENYDRAGDYDLLNMQIEGSAFPVQAVATWVAATNVFTFMDAADEIRWVTGAKSSRAPDELVACAPGQRWDDNAGFCIFCPINWYSEGGVGEDARCIACDAGWVSNADVGATGCTECQNGTYRTLGDEQCILCPLGTYGSAFGQSECAQCPFGRFAPREGLTACEVCGSNLSSQELFTTMTSTDIRGEATYVYLSGASSSASCGCDRHAREDSRGECIPCTEGMVCGGMDDVRIEAGYYAEAIENGALSVFECHGDGLRCAGGLPGLTCAPGRTGVTCAECQDGMTPSNSGGCVECKGSDTGPFLACLFIGILCLVAVYYVIDGHERVGQSHALLLIAMALGQLVTVSQQLGVVGMLTVHWEEPLKSFMRTLGVLTFDIDVLRLNCVSSQGPLERFSLKVSIIFITVGLMIVIHSFFVILRHSGAFREQMKSLVAALGTMFMVFYIAVTTTVLEPLQCQEHPNGKWTIRGYPSVICWETSDHKVMLVIGTLAFFAVPVAYFAMSTVVVRQFPRRMQAGDIAFLSAFSFLFVRFRPSQHTYVLIQMLRSFLIAVVLIIPDISMLVLSLEMVLLLGFAATLHLKPWRVSQANLLDVLFSGGILIVVCMASLFIERHEMDLHRVANVALAIILLMLALCPCAIFYGIYRSFIRAGRPFQFFLCHHKAGSGAFTRLLKMCLMDSSKVLRDVFIDSDNLDNLDRLFNYVAHDTECLVVVASSEIFTRPWCIGEMCTAHVKNVPTLLVALPSFMLPNDRFIEEITDRVESIEVLTENGISRAIQIETLQWIASLPLIHVPQRLNKQVMSSLVNRLVSKEGNSIDTDFSPPASEGPSPSSRSRQSVVTRQSILIYDRGNMEAAATAHIVRRLLVPLLSHASERIPQVLEETLPPGTSFIVVVCTNGIFDAHDSLQVLAQVPASISSNALPLLCEQGFRFPSKEFAEHLQHTFPGVFEPQDEAAIAFVVSSLFKEIAINFYAQQLSQAHLGLAAKDVARRLLAAKGFSNSARHLDVAGAGGTRSSTYRSSVASSSTEAGRSRNPLGLKVCRLPCSPPGELASKEDGGSEQATLTAAAEGKVEFEIADCFSELPQDSAPMGSSRQSFESFSAWSVEW